MQILVGIGCMVLFIAAQPRTSDTPQSFMLLTAIDESAGYVRVVSTVRNVREQTWRGCICVEVEGWYSPNEETRRVMAALLSSDPTKPLETIPESEDVATPWRVREPSLLRWDPHVLDCECLAKHIRSGESVSDTTIVRYETSVHRMFPRTFEAVVRLVMCDKESDPPMKRVLAIDSVRVDVAGVSSISD